MEIRIGVVYSPREIEIDMGDDVDGEKIVNEITTAMSGESSMMWFTDRRGHRIGVATDKVSFVEVGGMAGERRVGFSAG